MKNTQIFISYRRDGGQYLSAFIADYLKNKGYEVFLDIRSIGAGKYDEQIHKNIDECTDFVLILSPRSLDRCFEKEDWFRQEIEHALKGKKNIIPVFVPGFTFPDSLPAEIEQIKFYQGVEAVPVYFEAMLEKIEKMFVCNERKAEEKENGSEMLSGLFQMSYVLGKGIMGFPVSAVNGNRTAQDKYEFNEFKKAIAFIYVLIDMAGENAVSESLMQTLYLASTFIYDPHDALFDDKSNLTAMISGYSEMFDNLMSAVMHTLSPLEFSCARIGCALGCMFKSAAGMTAFKMEDCGEMKNNFITFAALVTNEIVGLPIPSAVIDNAKSRLENTEKLFENKVLCINTIEYIYNSVLSGLS